MVGPLRVPPLCLWHPRRRAPASHDTQALLHFRHVRAPCWAGEGGPPTSAAGAAGDAQLSFGTHLRRLRLRAGFSQETLSVRAGVSVATIGALEDGRRRRAYPSTLEALADALSLTSSDRRALLELSTGASLGT